MRAAITGTPGVGKTTVSDLLEEEVLDLNEFVMEKGLTEDKDKEMDSFNVPIEKMKKAYEEDAPKHDIVEGHLSHHLGLSPTIVLRCSPEELEERMEDKDWSESKVQENLEAEVLDVILVEAAEMCDSVYEVDTTGREPEEVKEDIMNILDGKTEDYSPGSVDWTGEFLFF